MSDFSSPAAAALSASRREILGILVCCGLPTLAAIIPMISSILG